MFFYLELYNYFINKFLIVMSMLKLGWFSTGNGQGSLGFVKYFIEFVKKYSLNISLEYVFINRDYGEKKGSDEFIDYLKKNKINVVNLSSKKFRDKNNYKSFSQGRTEYDKEVKKIISNYDIDFIVMAGYMLILSDFLCKDFRFINLHPALPNGPKGTWTDVVKNLIISNSKESGLNVHYVTNKLDSGKSLGFCKFDISQFKDDWEEYYFELNKGTEIDYTNLKLFYSIRNQILDREKILLMCVVEDLLKYKNNLDDIFAGNNLISNYETINYSVKIERILSRF